MTESVSTLERAAKSARTPVEMLDVVQKVVEWPAVEAIPPLARVDRRASGWLFSVTAWVAATLVALLVTSGLLLFWIAEWVAGIQVSAQLVDRLHAGLGIWVTAGAVALAAVILFYDRRLHDLVETHLALDIDGLPFPMRWYLRAIRLLFYLLAVIAVGAFLAVVCLPIVTTAVDWLLWLIRDGDTLLPYVTSRWMVGLSVTIIVALAVWGLRAVRKKAIRVAVGTCVGLWGLMRLVLAANALLVGSEWAVAGVILGAALLNLIRIPFVVARAMALPLRWFANSSHRLVQRLRLRKLLRTTVRHHRRRNVSRTGKKWKLALCSKCIARLERQQERLGYRRRLRYARCRHCHSDQDCYQDVKQTQGWLDRNMTEQQEQAGDTVRVNLLSYLTDRQKQLPLDLDTVIVAEASDHEVEAFLTLYQEQGKEQPVRPLHNLSYRVHTSAPIGPNVRAMLGGTFAREENA